ncbi:MAG: hypothetical protein HRT36_02115 [Alphaproteobacteria bacterium]|nr:hypothetical protein [Alphaproteobacteria bacterium]
MSIVKFDILKIVFKKLLKPDDLGNLHVFCYILETFHKVPTDSGCVLHIATDTLLTPKTMRVAPLSVEKIPSRKGHANGSARDPNAVFGFHVPPLDHDSFCCGSSVETSSHNIALVAINRALTRADMP